MLSLFWFRQDLRLEDNAALAAAIRHSGAVLPVYIHAPDEAGKWAPGGATLWWLHHALADLAEQLARHGLPLTLRSGLDSATVLEDLVRETGATALFWNRCYEPLSIARDQHLKAHWRARGLTVETANSALLFEPHTVANKTGQPYKVFTPYWKETQTRTVAQPVTVPLSAARVPEQLPRSESLESLRLLPTLPWAAGIERTWRPTREGALKKLRLLVEARAEHYAQRRDFPAEESTSRLAPFLHFGQIGVREVWAALTDGSGAPLPRTGAYLRQLIWREFTHHTLYHFPHTPEQPLQEAFAHFPWVTDATALRRWQRGQTGYPIVDAGMRELWQTGWMHNRSRMIVASFLVKDLRISWLRGAEWFWDTLVDADLANNTFGWQWAGGCGADAAPYFRVFNPMLQGAKFDRGGDYVRRYCPELSRLPDAHLHAPWEAPEAVLKAAGVRLGENYPLPIVNHKQARDSALAAWEKLKALRS